MDAVKQNLEAMASTAPGITRAEIRFKAIWQVRAGMTDTMLIDELSKVWAYTEPQYEEDVKKPADQETIFSTLDKEAHEYARELTNPARVNYVEVRFFWL